MKTPASLLTLIDEGIIDEVLRPLKSGKEAAVYVVRAGGDIRSSVETVRSGFQCWRSSLPGRKKNWNQHRPKASCVSLCDAATQSSSFSSLER